jgi:hypothetical protein
VTARVNDTGCIRVGATRLQKLPHEPVTRAIDVLLRSARLHAAATTIVSCSSRTLYIKSRYDALCAPADTGTIHQTDRRKVRLQDVTKK